MKKLLLSVALLGIPLFVCAQEKPQTCFDTTKIPKETRWEFRNQYAAANWDTTDIYLEEGHSEYLKVVGLGPKDPDHPTNCLCREKDVSDWLNSVISRLSEDYPQICSLGFERVEVYARQSKTCPSEREYALYLAWVTPKGLVRFPNHHQLAAQEWDAAAAAEKAREQRVAREKPLREAQFKRLHLHLGESQEEVKRSLQANAFRTTITVQDFGDGGQESGRVVGNGDVWVCSGGWAKPPHGYLFAVECLANSKEGLPLRLMFIMKERIRNPDSQEVREVRLDRLLTADYNDGEFHIESPVP